MIGGIGGNNYGYGAYANEYKEFGYQFQTSDGDKISIDLSQEKDVSYEGDANGGTLNLTLIDTFQFSYEGNGISDQDRKEIAEALAKIKPKIEAFFGESAKQIGLEFESKLSSTLSIALDKDGKPLAQPNGENPLLDKDGNPIPTPLDKDGNPIPPPKSENETPPAPEKTESDLVERLRNLLPNKKNENHGNFVKSSVVQMFEEMLNAFQNSIQEIPEDETIGLTDEQIEENEKLVEKQAQTSKALIEKQSSEEKSQAVESAQKDAKRTKEEEKSYNEIEEKKDIFMEQMFNTMKNLIKNLSYDYDNISSNLPKYI
jgi:hypothetical protein